MGECLIYCADCLDLLPRLPEKSIDLILCDLPYGTTACRWDSVLPLETLWKEIRRIRRKRAATVLTAAHPFTAILGASNLKELKYSWVWVKSRATGHLNAKKMPLKSHEDVLVFYDRLPTYNPQGLKDCSRDVRNSKSDFLRGKTSESTSTVSGGINRILYKQNKTNYPRTVLFVASEGNPRHPTQKPVALMEYLICTYSNEGDWVLDFTMGSGTTGVACKKANRNFIGIEKDQKYFNIAKDRIENGPNS